MSNLLVTPDIEFFFYRRVINYPFFLAVMGLCSASKGATYTQHVGPTLATHTTKGIGVGGT